MVKPKICLTLTGKTLQEDADFVKKYSKHIDIVELRVDHLSEDEQLNVRKFPSMINIPCILTIRRVEDGGLYNSGEFSRTALFGRALAFADQNPSKNFAYVDFEEDFHVPGLLDSAQAFGVKIIDEAHLCFKQTIELDLYSNVPKNIYLTATFTRSDYKEKALYDLVFGNTMRFGQELETAKNVIYQFVPYNSNPSYSFQNFIHTSYGVSATKWSDYAFTMDKYETVYHVFFDVLREAKTHSGKILVVIPKIKYCEIIAQMIRDEYPDEIVATIHSKHTKDENENSKKCASIIVTTTSSMGTGSDIEHIRSLIIMEPYSSEVTAKQLTGRLRPYVQGGDSYAYELVDTGFHSIVSMVNKRITKLKEICKSVKNWR